MKYQTSLLELTSTFIFRNRNRNIDSYIYIYIYIYIYKEINDSIVNTEENIKIYLIHIVT